MAILERAQAALAFARQRTMDYLRDFPEDKYTHQPWPGANHVAWALGHLMVTDNWVLTTFGGANRDPDGKLSELYGMGSRPTDEPARYASPADLRGQLERVQAELLRHVERMGEAELLQPCAGELAEFAPDKLGLLFQMAWHEGMHAGQIVAIRKALGLAPVMG